MKVSWLFVLVLLVVYVAQLQGQRPEEIQYRENVFNGPILDFQFLTEQTVMVRTEDGIHFSFDSGKSWTNYISHICSTAAGCIHRIQIHPQNKKSILAIGQQDYYWLPNVDQLQSNPSSFHKLSLPFATNKPDQHMLAVRFHPTLNKLLFLMEGSLVALCDSSDLRCQKLQITEDKLYSLGWGSNEVKRFDENFIFGIKETTRKSILNPSGTTTKVLFRFNLHNNQMEDLVYGAEVFYFLKEFLFIAGHSSDGEGMLKVSRDHGYTIYSIQLPMSHLKDKAYTILDSSEGAIFLNVLHDINTNYGNVYLSDATGSRYSLSLFYNRRSGNRCDFHKVKSMEGVYIANIVNDAESSTEYVSRITFDKGGLWQPIQAPELDSIRKAITCNEQEKIPTTERCPLHLHGLASSTMEFETPILSYKESVGVILALGNTGAYLKKSASPDTNVYISRDAGLNWEEISKGPHVFNMLDHGGLLLLSPSKVKTSLFMYSWNEGLDWVYSNFTRADDPMEVINIHTYHNNPLSKFAILQGESGGSSYLVHIDFSNFHERICSGIANSGTVNSDYEFFKPHTYNSKCFLGRVVQYTRRKRDATCFNTEITEKPKEISHCPCGYEDYECDFGYTPRLGENGMLLCEKQTKDDTNEPLIQTTGENYCYGYYNESRGYARIPGDSCVGGLDLDPISHLCPSNFTTFIIVLLLALMSILFTLVMVLMYKNRESLQRFFIVGHENDSITKIQEQELYQQGSILLQTDKDDDDDDDLEDNRLMDDDLEDAEEIEESKFANKFNTENVRRKNAEEKKSTSSPTTAK